MESNTNDKKAQRTQDTSDLLDLVIKAMRNQLSRKPCEECGYPGTNASDVNNAVRFLKDNGFGVDKEQTEDFLSRLVTERKAREAEAKASGKLVQIEDVQSRKA